MDIASGRQLVDEMRAMHPGSHIYAGISGHTEGNWDRRSYGTGLFKFAVGNASNMALRDSTIGVTTKGIQKDYISVHNDGTPIHRGCNEGIFHSYNRGETEDGGESRLVRQMLGSGLFITNEIVSAHGGRSM